MRKNICRPIIWYNDSVPPYTSEHNWEYRAFGFFDGVDVGKNIFSRNKYDWKKIWNYSAGHVLTCEGHYSSQVMFAIRTEDESEELKDEEFWEKNEEYPFIFFALIQFDGLHGFPYEQKQKFEKHINKEGNVKAITYVTLDSNDLFLVFKCKEYSCGAAVIDHLHKEKILMEESVLKVRYTFTIAAIKRELLNEKNNICSPDSYVEVAFVNLIERAPGKADIIFEKIKEQLGAAEENCYKKQVTGCDDTIVVIKGVRWSEYLKLYRDNTGILCNSNTLFTDCLIGVTTNIGWSALEKGAIEESEKEESIKGKGDKANNICAELRQMCKGQGAGKESEQIEERTKQQRIACFKALYEILNSLQKFENTEFQEYIFFSLFSPLEMLIKLIGKSEDRIIYDEVYRFLQGINLVAQNSIKADRHFTQNIDLNAKIYDTPVKLNAFYNAFAYRIKLLLNGEKEGDCIHRYEMLVCPGSLCYMKVYELFLHISDNERLLMVEMPEWQVFDLKGMMIKLGHEIAHYVGRGLRNREKRYDCAIELLARSIRLYLENDAEITKEIVTADSRKIFDEVEDFLGDLIKEQLKQYQTEEGLKEQFQNWKEEDYKEFADYKYHTGIMIMTFKCAIVEVLSKEQSKIFSRLLYSQRKENERGFLDKGSIDLEELDRKQNRLMNVLDKGVHSFMDNSVITGNLNSSLCLENALGINFYLLKECFADLIAILLLEVSIEDYLYAIIQDSGEKEVEVLIKTETAARITLVAIAMIFDATGQMRQGEERWNADKLTSLARQENEIGELAKVIGNFYNEYIHNDEAIHRYSDKFNSSCTNVTYDYKTLQLILEYLWQCRETFASEIDEEKHQELNCIYCGIVQEENVEKRIFSMRKIIEDYKSEIMYKPEKGYGKNI